MANRISKNLKNQKKGLQFLQNYNRHKHFKGKSKREFNQVLDKTVTKLVDEKYHFYFNRNRLKNLLYIYSIASIWLLGLLIVVLVMLKTSVGSSFNLIMQKNLFLIVLFFILGLLGLSLANLIINLARFNLWKQIINNNKIIILENLLKEFKIKNIYFLPLEKNYIVAKIEPIKIFIPQNKNHKIVKLESEKSIKNSIYFNDKTLITTFSESFINQQIKSILANKKMHLIFKEINLNFENGHKGKITLNVPLTLDLILIIIFITSTFVIYTYNSQKTK